MLTEQSTLGGINGDTLPVPVSVTACGSPVASSARLNVAVRTPALTGVNVTVVEQEAAAGRVSPQLLVSVKELAAAPAIEIPEIFIVVDPEFVNVTICGAPELPTTVAAYVRDVALSDATMGTAVAIPLNMTVCGEPAPLSAMFRVAVDEPAATGVKTTAMLHVAPAATVVPQVLVCEKFPGLLPARDTPATMRGAFPLLVRSTLCAADDCAATVEGNTNDAELMDAVEVVVDCGAPTPGSLLPPQAVSPALTRAPPMMPRIDRGLINMKSYPPMM